MAVTRRGKLAVSLAGALAVTGVGVGALALTGHAPPALQRAIDNVTGEAKTPPPVCPLTGTPAPHGSIPDRPVLAVKIENLPEARPQLGQALVRAVRLGDPAGLLEQRPERVQARRLVVAGTSTHDA